MVSWIRQSNGKKVDLITARGSFGSTDGAVYETAENGKTVTYTHIGEKVTLTASVASEDEGVFVRRDTLRNTSGEPLSVRYLTSRFVFDGGDYEVYTQYNNWQHESLGAWQPLVTEVKASNCGIRTCEGATPMLAVRNRQTGKCIVFHLLPNCHWQMSVKHCPLYNRYDLTVIELGFENTALDLAVSPDEVIELPAIVFFECENTVDFDAYKLHNWVNRVYPRRSMPLIYNTWLYHFDRFTPEELMRQVDAAADLGIEYFVIDAGWFGKPNAWGASVGDWRETDDSATQGRMKEIADHVRDMGMIFGLWFEPERAEGESKLRAAHPEYYIGERFLDFGNDDAREMIQNVMTEAIERYGIRYMKFDFNAGLPFDPSGAAFYRYHKGQEKFIAYFRERYPDLYLTNCASGGFRMELTQGMRFDSFWLSDNQSPIGGLRILRETVKRMPSCMIERWNVQTMLPDIPVYPNGFATRAVNCDNATWDAIVYADPSYIFGFLTGGPCGFSCNVADFTDEYKAEVRDFITRYKRDRDFFRTANTRVLCEGNSFVSLEYADPRMERCVVQLFTFIPYQESITVYPKVDPAAEYDVGGKTVCGAAILRDGLTFTDFVPNRDNFCMTLELRRK